MKKALVIIGIVLLVVVTVGVGYIFFKKTVQPKTIYEVTSPIHTDIVKKTVATGAITPRKEIELKSQVSGVVEKIYVDAGTVVKTNDIIARIKIIPDVVMVNNAEMRLKTAVINFKNAQKELERQKKLFNDKVISEIDYNRYVLEYQLREQEVEASENNLELVKEGASKKSGAVSNIVRSTATGMVLDIPVKEGTFVIETNTFNDGTTIAYVANMEDIIFEGKVDESEVGKIREGMTLDMKIGALDNEDIKAKLEYISPKGVEEDGAIQFEIKAAIELKEGVFLRSGYSANADIVLDKRDSILAVNEGNVIYEDDKAFIEVEKAPQEFEKREVKLGLSDGINVEVVSGLTINDKIKKQ